MLVKEFMSKGAFLRPDQSLREAVELFQLTNLEAAPVVDEEHKVIGIFTKSRLFAGLLEGCSLDEPVYALMKQDVVTVPPDMSMSVVTEHVRHIHVGQAVVTSESGQAVGMLTKADVIRALLTQNDLLSTELGTVVDSMHNGVIAINAQGEVTTFNPAAERILGISAQWALGMHIQSVLPESNLINVLKTGTAEIGRKHKMGNCTVVSNCTPIVLEGRIIGATSIFSDVTEYEKVAQELASVKKLQRTMENILALAYDGIIVVDQEGIITMVNRAICEFLNTQPEMLVGKPIQDVIDNSRLHIVAKTGVAEIAQVQVIRGHRFLVSRLPIIEEGRVVGAVGKITFRGLEELKEMVRRLESLENQVAYYREELSKVTGAKFTFDHIVSSSVEVMRLKKMALQAARGSSNVLILGETGTGKELFAQAIHNASMRRLKPFIKINCAAIPESLLESEFFGYAEGAFTGALKGGKPGKFELADGGTIFLDEIGDMPVELQAKLLRVLQDREIERVGGTQVIPVDVRVIAASNRDLAQLVREGRFREDLFYRLNVVCLQIPPLRERKEDVLPLAHCFVEKHNQITGRAVKGISPDALAVLQAYDWPGNVRELENVIERAMNLDPGEVLLVSHLPAHLQKGKKERPEGLSFQQTMESAERSAIMQALRETGGNRSHAARLLGMSRSRFYERLRKLGIT
ncbi:MAG: sigma-54-dependent Fis family transcriptional regulator [Bacillota bacterium]